MDEWGDLQPNSIWCGGFDMGLLAASMGAGLRYPGEEGVSRIEAASVVERRRAAQEMYGGRRYSHQSTTSGPEAESEQKRVSAHRRYSVRGNIEAEKFGIKRECDACGVGIGRGELMRRRRPE
ncbi:hypothetical protein V492_06917 [Pseudogymnoascus sp. VKM F-4246]|nr:hypothetical protein V492_06917 [Pseudogymnoascus sp. VKM F-4246]